MAARRKKRRAKRKTSVKGKVIRITATQKRALRNILSAKSVKAPKRRAKRKAKRRTRR